MTECSKCGDCCENFYLSVVLDNAYRKRETLSEPSKYDIKFAKRFFRKVKGTKQRYSCLKFDKETRLCTAHDKRPYICKGFPWYTNEPSAEKLGSHYNRCSFWADLPEDTWPVEFRSLNGKINNLSSM